MLVINSDILTNFSLNKIVEYHVKEKNKVTLGVISYYLDVPFGVLDFNEEQFIEIIEKHVKLNDKLKSLDSVFSLSVKNFEKFVNSINQSYISLGKKGLFVSNNEKKSLIFKRSIFISNHIKKGEKFSSKNIKIVRPSHGLHPKYYKRLIGRVAKSNYSKGYPTNLAMLK